MKKLILLALTILLSGCGFMPRKTFSCEIIIYYHGGVGSGNVYDAFVGGGTIKISHEDCENIKHQIECETGKWITIPHGGKYGRFNEKVSKIRRYRVAALRCTKCGDDEWLVYEGHRYRTLKSEAIKKESEEKDQKTN